MSDTDSTYPSCGEFFLMSQYMRFWSLIAYVQNLQYTSILAYAAELEVWILVWVSIFMYINTLHARIQGGGGGVGGSGPPWKKYKNIGFSSNTGPYTLKNHKATKPVSMLSHNRHASETPFKWRFAYPLIN